jgi:hypothetical protein
MRRDEMIFRARVLNASLGGVKTRKQAVEWMAAASSLIDGFVKELTREDAREALNRARIDIGRPPV